MRQLLARDEFDRLLDLLEIRKYQAREAQRRGYQRLENSARVLDERLGYRTLRLPRPEKRAKRIIRKVEEELNENRGLDLEEAVRRVKDLAGGRIAILHLQDIPDAHAHFCESLNRVRVCKLDGEEEDYIREPKPSGYRALHQGLLVRLQSGEWFSFEVQFMTFLQLDWAQKEHLVYENPERFPAAIREELRKLSDALHEASMRSDILRTAIRYYLSASAN